LLKLPRIFIRNRETNKFMKILPTKCPACNNQLKVRRLLCQNCETEIEGIFDLPQLAKLPAEDQDFILRFIKSSGSLKEMAKFLKLSYPTVRNRLDEIIEHIKTAETLLAK
jgi:hypothetical protein